MPVTKPCVKCGELVTRPPSHMKKDNIYCDKKCFYSRNRGDDQTDTKVCIWCEDVFNRKPKESWSDFGAKQYCSYECYWLDSNTHSRHGASMVFLNKWSNDDVFIEKMRNRVYGIKHSQGVSNGVKGRKFTKKEIENIRENTIRTWKIPEIKAKRISKMARSFQGRKTSIEIIVEELLVKLNVEFEIQIPISGFITDFFIESLGAVIEADGDYWHSLPKVIERDKRKNKAILSEGYKLLRLTETEIHDDPTYKIKEFLGIE